MNRLLTLACAAILAAPAPAQGPTPPTPGYGTTISIEEAMALIQAGMKEAGARKLKMAFAVVEPSGELVAFARMDDVPYASIRLAQQKASTSARLRISTGVLEQRVLGGRTVLMSSDEVLAIAGGLPVIKGGKIIGALGVSGATAPEDAAVAGAALATHK